MNGINKAKVAVIRWVLVSVAIVFVLLAGYLIWHDHTWRDEQIRLEQERIQKTVKATVH